jgi:histidine ammonia-lyase
MGMTSATKLRSVVRLAELATAIELMTAAQALEYRAPLVPGRGVKQAYDLVRGLVTPLTVDRATSKDIEEITNAIRQGVFDDL